MTERFDKLTKLTPCASITTNSTRAELKPCPSETCPIGSCRRHKDCMYLPCRNARAPDPREDDAVARGNRATDKQRDDLLLEALGYIEKTRTGQAHKLRVVDLENWLSTARALGFETGGENG